MAIGAALKAFGETLTKQDLSSQMAAEHAWFIRGDDPPWGKGDKLTKPYAESPVMHRCVKVLADIISGIPFELFEGDSDDPVDVAHPVARVFARPNERYSGRQLMSRTVMDTLLFGNAFWFLDGLAGLSAKQRAVKFPMFLRPLPACGARPKADPLTGRQSGWTVMTAKGQKDYTLEEIAHFFLENPYDDVMGMSEVGPASLDMSSMHIAALTNIRMLRKGGPGVILERADPNSAALYGGETDDSIIRSWNENFREEDDRNALLLPPGLKANRDGATQREMDFEKLLRFSREQQAGSVGVPPSLIGILEYANYANMSSQLEYVYHFAAFPLANRIQDAIQVNVLDRFGTGLKGYFKTEAVKAMYQNLNSLLDGARKLVDMGVPFTEVNERLEIGIDTDKYPWLAKGYIPFGMTPVDALDEEEDDDEDALPQKATQARELSRSAKWMAYMRTTDRLERLYLGAWRAFLGWMQTATLANMAGRSERVTQASGDDVPPDGAVDAKAIESTEEPARRSVVAGRKSLAAEVQADMEVWGLLDPRVTKLVQGRTVRIKLSGRQAAARVRATISEGVTQGESVQELADRVRQKFREEYAGQALTVARTETLSGFSAARHESMTEAGITRHEWLSARDGDRVRESHRIDGQTVTVGTPFSNGLLHPLDPDGPPEEVINCRCVAVAVVEAA